MNYNKSTYSLLYLILLFAILFPSIPIRAQDDISNLKLQYNNSPSTFPERLPITFKYVRALFFDNKVDESFKIIDDNLKIAIKYKDGKYAMYLYCQKAMNLNLIDELDQSNKTLLLANSFFNKTNDPEAKGYYHYCEGWINNRTKNETLAVKNFLRAITYFNQVPDNSTTKISRLSTVYKELVAIYANLKEYELQEKYSYLAIETAQKQKNPEFLFDAYMALGYMFENKLYEDQKNQKLRELTEKYYLLAFNLYNNDKSLQSVQSRLSYVSNNLGNLYFNFYPTSYHKQAEQYALLANKIAKKYNIYEHIASSSGLLSEIALENKDFNKAKEYLLNAITELDKKSNANEHIYLAIYSTLSDINEQEGNLSEAIKFKNLYLTTYQKIYDQDKLEITKRLESQFEKEIQQQKYFRLQLESEKKEQQIKLMHALDKQQKQDLENLKLSEENQKKKLELAELESQKQEQNLKLTKLESLKKSENLTSYIQQLKLKDKINKYYVIFIISILLFVFLLFYAFFQRLNRLKEKEKLHLLQIDKEKQHAKISTLTALLKGQEDERTRIAKDLHDGLGGLLSGTKIQLTNLINHAPTDNSIDLSKTIDQIDGAVDELRRVAHNLMPDLLLKFGLEEALKEYANRMENTNLDISVQFLSYQNQMPKETQLLTYRIIQELVNNSIKHANPKQIIIQLVEDTDKYYLTVEDDGIGFDIGAVKINQSAGLLNIQSRVEFLKGNLIIHSEKNLGSSFEINFPKNQS